MKTRVVLLDLDQTIVGDVEPLIVEQVVSETVDNPSVASKVRKDMDLALKEGALRPGFREFVLRAQSMGIELFVYTAAEDKWAARVIAAVERVAGVKLNRPIFARSQCVSKGGVLYKSIYNVKPAILRAVKKKLGPKAELDGDIVLVDNTPGILLPGDSGRQVLCPSYNYVVVVNALRSLPRDLLHKELPRVANALHSQTSSRHSSSSVDKLMASHHEWIAKSYVKAHAVNKEASADTFWSRFPWSAIR